MIRPPCLENCFPRKIGVEFLTVISPQYLKIHHYLFLGINGVAIT